MILYMQVALGDLFVFESHHPTRDQVPKAAHFSWVGDGLWAYMGVGWGLASDKEIRVSIFILPFLGV